MTEEKKTLGKDLVTTAEVGVHFNVQPKTVRAWIKRYSLKAIWNGKEHLFEPEEIKKLKEKLRLVVT